MIKLGKKKTIVILAVVLGLAAVFLVTTGVIPKVFSGHHSVSKDVYYCPMHPTYTSDGPGSCPICNMSLVKRESEESASSSESQGMQNMPGVAMGQERHTGHGAPEGHQSSNIGASPSTGAMKSFTVEELIKMKPGEICLLHKCKHGTCLIPMTEEFARLGKCPHCKEDLGVMVKNAMPEGLAAVKLSPDSQRAIGVETEAVKK